jgi:hypothetical protein
VGGAASSDRNGHSSFEIAEKCLEQFEMILQPNHTGAGVLDPAERADKPDRPNPQGGKDQALQLVRRLDWRFLLPNPILGDVAYVGSMEGTLPNALQTFSELVTIVLPSDSPRSDVEPGYSYETVVLRSGGVAAVRKAKPLVAPGGYLYWEVERAARIDHVRRYVKAVDQLGFDHIQVHWHRPDFETCLEMIPLTDSKALRFAFARCHESTAKRLKFAAGRVLMATGLLAHLVPCFSIIARKTR